LVVSAQDQVIARQDDDLAAIFYIFVTSCCRGTDMAALPSASRGNTASYRQRPLPTAGIDDIDRRFHVGPNQNMPNTPAMH
jgi:hypothetical protein